MKFLIKRVITLLFTMFLVSVFSFVAFQIIPGDSAALKLGMDADQAAIDALREAMGLNRSVFARFFDWFLSAIKGDFGTSSQYSMSVAQLLSKRMEVTAWLAVLSIAMILVFSLILGLLASKKENGWIDRLITILSQTFMSIPPFFMGIILVLIFGITLRWFKTGSCPDPAEDFSGFLKFLIYPAIAIAIPKIAMTAKFLRSSLLREQNLDYVRTAKSKGSSSERILIHHILKNALLPVITFMGMVIGDVFAGSIIVEQVFNLPGIGKTLVVAISNRDFAVVQTVVLYIAMLVIVINFIVDVLYQWIDPRIKLD